MKKARFNRFPAALIFLLGLLLVVGFVLVQFLAGFVLQLLPDSLPMYAYEFLAELFLAVYGLGLILLFGYGRALKQTGFGWLRGIFTGGFFTAYITLVLTAQYYMRIMDPQGSWQSFLDILFFIGTMLLVGIAEEFLFRGVLLELFLERFPNSKGGILTAIWASSLLFGSLHILNVLSGVSPVSALVQALQASILGAIFAVLYLRTGNLWLMVIFHALIDLASMIPSGFFGTGNVVDMINQISPANLISFPILFTAYLVLLRPRQLTTLLQLREGTYIEDEEQMAGRIGKTAIIVGGIGLVFSFVSYGFGLCLAALCGALASERLLGQPNDRARTAKILSIIGLVISLLVMCSMGATYEVVDDAGLPTDKESQEGYIEQLESDLSEEASTISDNTECIETETFESSENESEAPEDEIHLVNNQESELVQEMLKEESSGSSLNQKNPVGDNNTESAKTQENVSALNLKAKMDAVPAGENPYKHAENIYGEAVLGIYDVGLRYECMYATDQKYYTEEDFSKANEAILKIIKNEIYARHGYIFQNPELYEYFSQKEWYDPRVSPSEFDESCFNEYEKSNLELLIGMGA